MNAYSVDPRDGVVRPVAIGTPRQDLAAMFAVSVPTIERWLRLKRETGSAVSRPLLGPPARKRNALPA